MKKMKKFLLLVMLLSIASCSWAASYPELGVCTGENVRLRDTPGTHGKVIGRVKDSRNQFIILGEERDSEGQLWYKIDNPTEKGTAYISARYVMYGWYHGNNGVIQTGEHFINVRLAFGIYPEKARILLGKAAKSYSNSLEYSGCKLFYDDEGTLQSVEVSVKGFAMAGVSVGDSPEKLLRLGMPEEYADMNEDYEGWTYRNNETDEEIFFQFALGNDGELIIDWIHWERPIAAG